MPLRLHGATFSQVEIANCVSSRLPPFNLILETCDRPSWFVAYAEGLPMGGDIVHGCH